jgi:hypothetical protein
MNETPIIGAGTDFSINANGYVASFLTDANDPALLKIPAGNWNFETYFSASSGGGSPTFYIELYKYNGTTFTLIASNSGSPKLISDGTNIEAYFSTLAVPETVLTLTDRLAVRIYVSHSGRTITLHTENGHLCQVITTFTTGLTALNGLTEQVQYFSTGTSGTDFNIASSVATHTFNLPTASATNRGALSSANWTTFNNKIGAGDTASMLLPYLRKTDTASMLSPYYRTATANAALATKLNISDTAAMLLGYTRVQRFTDSLTNVQSRIQTKQNILTLTTTGSSGAATLVGATLNIPNYAPDLSGYVPTSRTITINGTTQDLSANRTFSVGTVTSVSGTGTVSGLTLSGTVTSTGNLTLGGTLSLTAANVNAVGAITNNTSGTAANITATSNSTLTTLSALSLPYSQLTGTPSLSGFVTSVTASSPLASSGGTTPNITIAQSSGSTNGFLSSTDWTTFNGKQNALTNPVTGTGTTNYLPKFTGSTTVGNSALQEVSGNLGLGVTPSASNYKNIQNGYAVMMGLSSDFSAYWNANAVFDGGWKYIGTSFSSRYEQSSGSHEWYTAPSGTAGNPISFTQAMTLRANGNLLVGTTTDNGARLQVSGDVTISNGNQLSLSASSPNFTRLYRSSGLVLENNTYQITLSDAGVTALPSNTTIGGTLGVTGAATFSSDVTAASFFESSDSRLKNIVKRDGDVAYFKWKNGQDNKTHIGYIAQEVQKANPDQVKADEKGMLSVNYIEILVQKVRDLEKEIAELKKHIK